MPLDEDEWEQGGESEYDPQENLQERIFEFLQQHDSKAYSAKEIAREFGVLPNEEPTDSFLDALSRSVKGYGAIQDFVEALDVLTHEDKVEQKVVKQEDDFGETEETIYYRIK